MNDSPDPNPYAAPSAAEPPALEVPQHALLQQLSSMGIWMRVTGLLFALYAAFIMRQALHADMLMLVMFAAGILLAFVFVRCAYAIRLARRTQQIRDMHRALRRVKTAWIAFSLFAAALTLSQIASLARHIILTP